MSFGLYGEKEEPCPKCGEYLDIEVVFGVVRASCGCKKISDEASEAATEKGWPPKIIEIGWRRKI